MDSMAYSIVTRISRVVVTALVVASIALALLSSGAVHAQDNDTTGGSLPCAAPGSDGPPTIPEGTVIKAGDSYWQCMRGYWWKLPSKIASAGVTTLSPVGSTDGGKPELISPARLNRAFEAQ